MQCVREVMSDSPLVVAARVPAMDAQALAAGRGVHHLLVVDDGQLVGEVCVRDLEAALLLDTVEHVMQAPVIHVAPETSALDALDLMRRSGVGCLAVVDAEGALAGVVTHRDLRRAGILPGEKGVDLCASCGESHHLAPAAFPDTPVFCRDCLDQCIRPFQGDMYFTLGGGD